jgi:hypothetical protein
LRRVEGLEISDGDEKTDQVLLSGENSISAIKVSAAARDQGVGVTVADIFDLSLMGGPLLVFPKMWSGNSLLLGWDNSVQPNLICALTSTLPVASSNP